MHLRRRGRQVSSAGHWLPVVVEGDAGLVKSQNLVPLLGGWR